MGKIDKYKKKYKLLIISLIYSFDFSCFYGIVPGLGTVNRLLI